MPRSEFNTSEEFYPIAPEFTASPDQEQVDNEFEPIKVKDGDTPDKKAHDARKKARLKRNFLLQAAAVMVSIVLVTSAMGEDVLGGSFTGTMEEILEHVGAKTGVITVSMTWETPDDVDLHVITPSGEEIYYANRVAGGGELDVDMQAGDIVDHPVENIYFPAPEHGEYRVFIVNYCDREPGDPHVTVRVKIKSRSKEYRITLDDYYKDVCTFKY